MGENDINLDEKNIYECKLRGSLKVKNDKLNCVIGDIVEFDENEKVITKIYKRENFLHRPLLSNIDYIGILFAITHPKFDFNVFQKMILNANDQNIPIIFILTKTDLVSEDELDQFLKLIKETFKDDFPIFPISTENNNNISVLKEYINEKSITISGPSGAGKSTLINYLIGENLLTTNEISNKTNRGRHTTTESRFFKINSNTFIVDTPGFSSLEFPILENKKDLEKLFPEFLEFIPQCKFRDCIHINEPNCAIKENVNNGNISKIRYDFYLNALENIFNKL